MAPLLGRQAFRDFAKGYIQSGQRVLMIDAGDF
jgi:hypothetical protein